MINHLSNRTLFQQHLAHTSSFPLALEIENASGLYLYGPNGEKYMDLISGIAVSNLGHCHPAVVEAVQKQAATYMHLMVYGEYIQAPQVQLAELLTQNLPSNLNSVYFVNSGTEATEGALKLAKRYTGRSEIISCYNSYHGSTHGALSVMGNETFKQSFRPLLPGIQFINFGQISDIEQITEQTACVIIETIQGEAGVIEASKEYFTALRKRCTETGTLLILDEIQTGFGRTGKLWAFEHYGITPDILLLAKGMGGGMPIGAFVAKKEVMQSLQTNPILGHITTFGGHPVCCAASLATLQTIINERLVDTIDEKEWLFLSLLKHPSIKAMRSKGLMIAVEFESFEKLQKIINNCMSKGVLVDWFLHNDKSMRIAPPLIITKEEIMEACEKITNVLNSL